LALIALASGPGAGPTRGIHLKNRNLPQTIFWVIDDLCPIFREAIIR
jgi:hypothetical protein